MARRTKRTKTRRPASKGALAAKLFEALKRSAEVLLENRAKFAIIGGLAVAARGFARATGDVDFAVYCEDEAEAERLVFAAQQAGFTPELVMEDRKTKRLATVRTRDKRGVLVDLLFRSTGIERHVVEQATLHPIDGGVPLPVAALEHLLAMKVLANRPKDLADIAGLTGLASPAQRRAAVEAAREMVRAGMGGGRDLAAELELQLKQARGGPTGLKAGRWPRR